MTPLRRLQSCAALSGVLACLSGLPAAAQMTLDAAGMRQAATQALRTGDAARARVFAEALLKRDPEDLNAHLIHARALRDLGHIPPARTAARRAWHLANTDAEKYSAALITAQVLSSAGKRTRAQLWLRRASQHAPNDLLKARAKRDFRYVKQRNPWHTSLSFTLAPKSNINNGSARDRSELNYAISEILFGQPIEYNLGGSAVALSGLEFGGALRMRYRFHETPTTAHDLKAALSYRSFALSGSARNTAPDASGGDFAFGTASLGYGFQQINFARKGEFSFDLEAGQSWYGGARYASHLRAGVYQSYRPSRDKRYRFGVDVEKQFGQATPDVDTLTLSGNLTQRLSAGDTLFLGLSAAASRSIEKDAEYGEIELRSGYVLAKPVMGASLQFGLGAALRDYDVSRHSAQGRQDRKLFADVTATFTQIDYYGFNPSLTLSASKTDSNIGLYDVNRVGLSIGIKSAF
jgi:hypothetical protein